MNDNETNNKNDYFETLLEKQRYFALTKDFTEMHDILRLIINTYRSWNIKTDDVTEKIKLKFVGHQVYKFTILKDSKNFQITKKPEYLSQMFLSDLVFNFVEQIENLDDKEFHFVRDDFNILFFVSNIELKAPVYKEYMLREFDRYVYDRKLKLSLVTERWDWD